MFESIWLYAAAGLGFFHVAAPIAVHSTFRFNAKCRLKLVAPEELPQSVAGHIIPQIPQLTCIGFEFLGCYDCGELARHTHSYVGYFHNPRTNDFANVSVVLSQQYASSYLEFSTRFRDGSAIETNTNRVLPLTPGNPLTRIFRLPEIQDPESLYNFHRSFIEKYAEDFLAVGEHKGQEISRLVRVLENYGPRHVALGYMQLSSDETSYGLTWKGACLMSWRALWPTSFLRSFRQKVHMREEVRSLEGNDLSVLQKA
jgi:hypothetical protein